MKYLALLSVVATALAGKSFGIVTINSGSQYQYLSLTNRDGTVVVGNAGTEIDFVLNDDGSLVDTESQKYLIINSDNDMVLSDAAQTGFALNSDHLLYKKRSEFGVDSQQRLTFNETHSVGVLLRAMNVTDHADVFPKDASSSVVSSTVVSSTVVSTATSAAPTETATGFELLATSSDKLFHNTPIRRVESHLHVFSVGGTEGDVLVLKFNAGSTSLGDQTGRGVNLDSSTGELGDVAPFGREAATTGFSISNGLFAYDGKTKWRACPSAVDKYSLTNGDCVGGTGITLKVVYT